MVDKLDRSQNRLATDNPDQFWLIIQTSSRVDRKLKIWMEIWKVSANIEEWIKKEYIEQMIYNEVRIDREPTETKHTTYLLKGDTFFASLLSRVTGWQSEKWLRKMKQTEKEREDHFRCSRDWE